MQLGVLAVATPSDAAVKMSAALGVGALIPRRAPSAAAAAATYVSVHGPG